MSSYKVQFTVNASLEDTFDYCRQAIAESGLQIQTLEAPKIICKEASATKLNAWGGVASPVTMEVIVSQASNMQCIVDINGSVIGWFPGHVDGRVGALQNQIIVITKRNAINQSLSKDNSKTDFIDELERISELYKSGMLTAEEFQKAKNRLLG